MGVSKNRGTPKWMVYFMENPIKIDDLGGNTPIFWVDTHMMTYTKSPFLRPKSRIQWDEGCIFLDPYGRKMEVRFQRFFKESLQ